MATAKKAPARKAVKTTAVKPDVKMAAAGEKNEPKTETKAVEKKAEKPKEELGPKLRSKGDITKALQQGGQLLLTTAGLFRLVQANGSQNRVSKRRASAMIAKRELKLSKQTGEGKFYALAPASETKAEPKPEAK